ncbi:unnamed protein product, partial [Brachionus calyciflorus]
NAAKKENKECYLLSNEYDFEKEETKCHYGLCRICQDDSTGIHYGVPTCEPCKGFFKRSLLKNQKYKCKQNQDCKLIPKKTKKCKFCRWSKCVSTGMSVDKIRVGRKPNSIKQNINNEYYSYHQTYTSENYLNKSNQNQSIVVLDLLREKSYDIFINHTREFEEQERRAFRLIESGYEPIVYEMTDQFLQILRTKFLMFLQRHAACMLEIINDLPGFSRLSKNDINVAIRENFFSVLGIRISKVRKNGETFLMLDENIQFNRQVQTVLMGLDVQNNLNKEHIKLEEFQPSERELALLIPYFFSTFTINVKNTDLMREINEYYCRALYHEFCLNKRSRHYIQNFIQLVNFMPVLNKMCLDIDLTEQLKNISLVP